MIFGVVNYFKNSCITFNKNRRKEQTVIQGPEYRRFGKQRVDVFEGAGNEYVSDVEFPEVVHCIPEGAVLIVNWF